MVQDNFFWLTDPKPCEPKDLPKFDSSHELDMKRKRQADKERQQVPPVHQSPNQRNLTLLAGVLFSTLAPFAPPECAGAAWPNGLL